MSGTKGVLNQFGVIGFGTLLNMVIGFLTTPIITRLVGTTQYGQYSVYVLYSSIALMVLCLGLDQAIIRFFYNGEGVAYQSSLLRFCCMPPVLAASVLSVVFFLLEFLGIIHFEFGLTGCVFLCITVIFQIINRMDLVLLRMSRKTMMYSGIQVLYKAIFTGLTIVLCLMTEGDRFQILMVSTLVGYFAVTVIGVFSQREIWFWRGNLDEVHGLLNQQEIIRYSMPFILSMGITTVFQGIDKLTMNIFCGYEQIGVYSSALNLVHVFAIVQTTFNTVWMPLAVEHYRDEPDDVSFYRKGYDMITVVMFTFGWTLILMKDFFVLLLGPAYREAGTILPFLIFNPIMMTISEVTIAGIVFKKKSNMHVLVATLACVAHTIGSFLLVPDFGGRGAAISTAIAYTILFFARTLIANRYFKVDWCLGRFAVLVLITSLYAAMNTFGVSITVCIAVYLIMIVILIVMYRQTVVDGWAIVKYISDMVMKRLGKAS